MQSVDHTFTVVNDMETSFYHDNRANTDAPRKMKTARPMSLDFGGAPSQKKRATQTTQNLQPGLLGSPDLNMLKLASPELERMIIQQNGLVTTTPTPTQFINPKYVTEEQEAYARGFVDALAELHDKHGEPIPPNIANEQDVNASTAPVSTMTTLLASTMSMTTDIPSSSSMITTMAPASSAISSAGFQSHAQSTVMSMPNYSAPSTLSVADQVLPSTVVTTTCADMMPVTSQQQQYTTLMPPTSQPQQPTYTNLPSVQDNNRVIQLKQEEPQTVPNLGLSPPLSPINMESQERIKLERKRERNRVAARKCRTRKLERISRLEDRVAELKGQNSDLVSTATLLREQVCKLKSQILEHVKSGCQVMMSQNLL